MKLRSQLTKGLTPIFLKDKELVRWKMKVLEHFPEKLDKPTHLFD